MCSDIWFSRGVSTFSYPAAVCRPILAAPSWRMHTHAIAQPGEGERLVECDPVLHSVSKDAEAQVSIVIELILDLRIEPAIFRFAGHQA